MDYKQELQEAYKDLRKLCARDKTYEVEERNTLGAKIRNLQIKINQENQKRPKNAKSKKNHL